MRNPLFDLLHVGMGMALGRDVVFPSLFIIYQMYDTLAFDNPFWLDIAEFLMGSMSKFRVKAVFT